MMPTDVVDALAETAKPNAPAPHLLSVGLAAVDFVATVDHFPEPDEKMRSSSLLVEGGGNAANSACAMAGMAPYVQTSSLLTAVGDDANGKTIVEGLEQANVNVLAEYYPKSSPFSYIINHNDTRTIIHQPSSGDMSNKFAVSQLKSSSFDAVHFDVRYPRAAMAFAKKCVEKKIPYSVDVERPREGLDELLQDATVVICNSNYCKMVDEESNKKKDGDDDTASRLRRVMKQKAPKAKVAVQTLGGDGCCLVVLGADKKSTKDGPVTLGKKDDKIKSPTVSIKDNAMYCSAFPNTKVVDTTGAGDAIIGGFLSAFWAYYVSVVEEKGKDFPELPPEALAHILRIASRVAAKKVEQQGARKGLPKAKNDDFLKTEFKSLLQESFNFRSPEIEDPSSLTS